MLNILKNEEELLQEKISNFFAIYGVNGYINYNDLYATLTSQERKKLKKYLEKLKKNQYVINLLKNDPKFNIINKPNRMGYLVASILIGKTIFASKMRNKAVKDLDKNKSIKNIVKNDIDTYVNNDFRVSSKKIVKEVNDNILKNKSVKTVLGAISAIYSIEKSKAKTLYVTINTKLKVAEAKSKIKTGYYTYQGMIDCCEICRSLVGKQFSIDSLQMGVNAPPMHPSCRCWIEPTDKDVKLISYK